jgi:N-glycosylase/DNA lyase
VEFYCAPDDEAVLKPLIRDYLRLGDDLEAIYQTINLDQRIDSAIGRYRGLRLVRQDPWECLVSFICSSTSNIPRISANIADISAHFGRPVALDGDVRGTFPTPEALAAAGEQSLRDLGLGFRAKYVAAVSEIVASGKIDLFSLREAAYEDALEALTALPGVGDKVANCVLLFSLDKLEAFPVDVWLHRALQEWYLGGDGKLSRTKMRLWAQDYFKPYAGYASQYLFHNRRLMGRR